MGSFTQSSVVKPLSKLGWLDELRGEALRSWQSFQMPTRKTEAWKYTNLSLLETRDFFSQPLSNVDENIVDLDFQIEGLDAHLIVFINGEFSAARSKIYQDDEDSILVFSKTDEAQRACILERLAAQIKVAEGFSSLGLSRIDEGLRISVKANTKLKRPVHVVNVGSSSTKANHQNACLQIVLENGAEATVIEHFLTPASEQQGLMTALTDCVLQDNARLNYYRLQEEEEHALHIGRVAASLDRSAVLNSFFLSLGTQLSRVDIAVNLEGEGAESVVDGVYLPRNNQHTDFHSCVNHCVPHCQSHSTFRGIISDSARAVFNGRIHIFRDAQKSEAYLSNKNLLTSERAEVDTKPELEIYADDVRCAHGATVSQLNDEALHYLKTRGISTEESMLMLSFGFINELLDNLDDENVSCYCRAKLSTMFARQHMLPE